MGLPFISESGLTTQDGLRELAQSRGIMMTAWMKSGKISAAAMVLLPLVVLSALFGIIALIVSQSERLTFVSPSSLLIAGFLIYGATVGDETTAGIEELEYTILDE